MKCFVVSTAILLTAAGLCSLVTDSLKIKIFHAKTPSPVPVLPPPPPIDTDKLIREAALKHGLKESFVRSIVAAESGFDPHALSDKGAIGLMQVMPSTAEDYGLDATIPEQNVEAGTHYLSYLLARYRKSKNQLKKAIAAYNAGPGMVDKYRGIPPFRETRQYVTRVLSFLKKFERAGES